MIKVHIPDNHIAERTYIVKTMLSHYCGIDAEVIEKNGLEGYELHWEDKSIMIIDDFFSKIPPVSSYARAEFLPKKITQTHSIGLYDIPLLYGEEQLEVTPQSIVCHVDIFAGAFFMLSRWEESISEKRDLHNRFPASESIVVKEGFILRPIVDEYVQLLKHWLRSLDYPLPEETASFKVVPTCDVDIPFFWSSKPLWKILGGRLRKHFNPLKVYAEYQQHKKTKTDPYDTFDDLMTLAEAIHEKFQFNFIADGKTKYEGYYKIDDPQISKLIEAIKSRGHHIGLHPSYASHERAETITEEKQVLERAVGYTITTSRQHFLRFSAPETWRHLSDAGITEDSTLGYAAEPGFRCGTCKPFPVFDIQQHCELPLIERPMLVMDVSLRFYKNLSVEESITLCEKIKSEVRKHNGEFVFLWHNSTLSEIDDWESWKPVLTSVMEDNRPSQ